VTVPARLPIEVRGQLTERDHLDALRVVQHRLGSRWWSYALFLGGPAFIVVMTMLGGMSLQHAVIVNMFWIVVGPLMLFVGLPLSTRQTVRFLTKGNPAATAPQLYRFTETGFEERECPVEVSIAWSAIADAVETETLLLLFIGRTTAYIMPRRTLVAAGQVEAVRGLLRGQLGDRARLLTASKQPEAGNTS
jgi:YcxB-like protein